MKIPFGRMAWREIRQHPGRYVAILAIVALGVGFYAGLFVIEDAMLDTTQDYITEYNLYDFSVSSTLGLYEDDVKALGKLDGIKRAEGVINKDAICQNSAGTEQILRFMSISESISRPDLVAGRMPKHSDECLADIARYTEADIGSKIRLRDPDPETFTHKEYTIVGIATSPEYMNYQRGSTSLGGGSITSFCYIPRDGFAVDYFTSIHLDADTDAYVYSDEYKNTIKQLKESVTAELESLARNRGISIIEQAHAEIAEGVAAYEQGLIDLEKARSEANAQFADAEAQIADGYAQLEAGKIELAEMEEKVALALEKATADFNASMAEADELLARADELASAADYEKYLEVTDALTRLEEARVTLTELIKQEPDHAEYPDLLDRVEHKIQQIETEYAPLIKLMSKYHELRTKAQQIRDTAKDTFDKLDLAAKGLVTMQKVKLTEAQTDLTIAERKLNAERIKAERELAAAEKELNDAHALLVLPDGLDELTSPKTFVLTREQNAGYVSMETDSTIISGVVNVFPVFFVLVAALVCSTVMTRMALDERISLGTLKAMGYGRRALLSKYLIYAGSASLIGSVLGYFAGTFGMPRALWFAYTLMYDFTDKLVYVFDPVLLTACVLVALACCMGTAVLSVLSSTLQMPAQLMRPRVSASGKRVFFERIPFLWKPLPFLTKVAVRNIWRYKKRLLVMILGIGGSTALLVCGFGLSDSIKPIAASQFDEIYKYDYKITFANAQDEASLSAFAEQNTDKIGTMLAMHQSEQDVTSEHGSHKATLHVCDTLDGYIHLVRNGEDVAFPARGQVVINTRLAESLKVKEGDVLTLSTADGEIALTVGGIAENYIGNVVYMSLQTYEHATGKSPETKTALICAPEGAPLDTTAASLRQDETVAYVEENAARRDMITNMMQSMNYVVLTIIVCAGALAYIVLFNLTNINITERVREIATLRVIGLYKGETRRYVMTENYVLSVIGALLGMPAGVLLHKFVMSKIVIDSIAFPVTIEWPSFLYAFALTVLFAFLVGLALRGRIDRIDMAESLKSVE